MPDQTLYTVKITTENIRLALTPSALGKAELYTELADRRVEEIAYAVNKGESELVEVVAQRLNNNLLMVANLAAAEYGKGGAVLAPEAAPGAPEAMAPTPVPEPKVFVATPTPTPTSAPTPEPAPAPMPAPEPKPTPAPAPRAPSKLEVTTPTPVPKLAPESSPRPAAESATLVAPDVVPEQAGGEVKVVRPRVAEDGKLVKWRKLVKRYAEDHPARLRALLETAPESVKPALLRAIAASEANYQIALGNIGGEGE